MDKKVLMSPNQITKPSPKEVANMKNRLSSNHNHTRPFSEYSKRRVTKSK